MTEDCSPEDDLPPKVELRTSSVEVDAIGIWSKLPISQDEKFGPVEGDKVQEAHPDMNPAYVWEIVDLDTKEHLWYIDATCRGNWMRNIKCARYLEEQNILSVQEGTDIYYKAMKDIPVGQELLTWFESVKLKKGRKRKKIPQAADSKPKKKRSRRSADTLDDEALALSALFRDVYVPTKKTKRQLMREQSQNSLKSSSGSSRGSPETVTQEPEVESSLDVNDVTLDVKREAGCDTVAEKQVDAVTETSVQNEGDSDDSDSETDSGQPFYQFTVKDEHVMRNRLGRKMFICDICSGLYKHSFSLKRHYLKHHINHTYVTRADLVNCHITKQTDTSPKVKPEPNPENPQLATDQQKDDISSTAAHASLQDVADVCDRESINIQTLSSTEKPDQGQTEVMTVNSTLADERNHVANSNVDAMMSKSSGDGSPDPVASGVASDVVEVVKKSACRDVKKTDDDLDSLMPAVGDVSNDSGVASATTDDATMSECDDIKPEIGQIKAVITDESLACVSSTVLNEASANSVSTLSADSAFIGSHSDPLTRLEAGSREATTCESIGPENGYDKSSIVQEVRSVSRNSQVREITSTGNGIQGNGVCENGSHPQNEEDKCEKSEEILITASCAVSESYAGSDEMRESDVQATRHENAEPETLRSIHDSGVTQQATQDDVSADVVTAAGADCTSNSDLAAEVTHEQCDDEISKIPEATSEKAIHDESLSAPVAACISEQEQLPEPSAYTEGSGCDVKAETTDSVTLSQPPINILVPNTDVNEHITAVPSTESESSQPSPSPTPPLMPGLYRCHTCSATFDTINDIRTHIKNHPEDAHTSRLLSCDQCDMKFTEKKNLMRHQAAGHVTAKTSAAAAAALKRQCLFCTKQFSSLKTLRRHERHHHGVRQTCEHCAATFFQSADLRKHIRRSHPTSYHACGFCSLYYGSKKLLVQHLEKQHDKKLLDNKTQLSNTSDRIEAIDPVLDRAESMRLASKHSKARTDDAFKYACTVCKKRFVDYTDMCRHRRLAHMRHLMDTVKTSDKQRYMRGVESTSIIRTRSAVERELVDFYACVSDNIKDNLSKHLMGTEAMINSAACHVKWDLKSQSGSSFDVTKNSEPAGAKSNALQHLGKYNFPKSFRLKDPDHSYKSMKLSDTKHQSYSLMADRGADALPPAHPKFNDPGLRQIAHPTVVDSGSNDEKNLCVVCKTHFSAAIEYRRHMREKHGVNASEIEKEIADEKQKCAASDAPAPPRNWLLKVAKPDVNIPVTLQHEKAEQDDAMDLSVLPTQAKRVKKRQADRLALVSVPGGKRVLVPPKDVCTDDPTEKFHRYMCRACLREFSDWPQLQSHHDAEHPTIERGFTIIDPHIKQVWTGASDPVGLLNVCSTRINAFEPKSVFHCTKCHKRFKCMPDLHKHMLACADPETLRPKYVWVYQYRKQKYSKMKQKRTCEWQKNTSLKRSDGDAHLADLSDADSGSVQNSNDGVSVDLNVDGVDDAKKRRKKPFEVTYNPTRHTRRREKTEIVDTSICGGCNEDFKTISLLERHIPVCRNKDKIRDLESLKSVHETVADNSDSDASDDFDPNKHLCIYCERQFTYMRGLRNHVFDMCTVRKQYVEKNEYLDLEWEEDVIEKTGGRKESPSRRSSAAESMQNVDDEQSKDGTEHRKLSSSSFDKKHRRRRRGFGWAHKNKLSAYNRPIKQVVSEDGYVYEYFVESERPIIAFDLSDTFILDVDKDKDEKKRRRKAVVTATTSKPEVTSEHSATVTQCTTTPALVTSPPLVHRPSYSHGSLQAEDLTLKPAVALVAPMKRKNVRPKHGAKFVKPHQGKQGKSPQRELITDYMKTKKSKKPDLLRKLKDGKTQSQRSGKLPASRSTPALKVKQSVPKKTKSKPTKVVPTDGQVQKEMTRLAKLSKKKAASKRNLKEVSISTTLTPGGSLSTSGGTPSAAAGATRIRSPVTTTEAEEHPAAPNSLVNGGATPGACERDVVTSPKLVSSQQSVNGKAAQRKRKLGSRIQTEAGHTNSHCKQRASAEDTGDVVPSKKRNESKKIDQVIHKLKKSLHGKEPEAKCDALNTGAEQGAGEKADETVGMSEKCAKLRQIFNHEEAPAENNTFAAGYRAKTGLSFKKRTKSQAMKDQKSQTRVKKSKAKSDDKRAIFLECMESKDCSTNESNDLETNRVVPSHVREPAEGKHAVTSGKPRNGHPLGTRTVTRSRKPKQAKQLVQNCVKRVKMLAKKTESSKLTRSNTPPKGKSAKSVKPVGCCIESPSKWGSKSSLATMMSALNEATLESNNSDMKVKSKKSSKKTHTKCTSEDAAALIEETTDPLKIAKNKTEVNHDKVKKKSRRQDKSIASLQDGGDVVAAVKEHNADVTSSTKDVTDVTSSTKDVTVKKRRRLTSSLRNMMCSKGESQSDPPTKTKKPRKANSSRKLQPTADVTQQMSTPNKCLLNKNVSNNNDSAVEGSVTLRKDAEIDANIASEKDAEINTIIASEKDAEINTIIASDKDAEINTIIASEKDAEINTIIASDKDAEINTIIASDKDAEINTIIASENDAGIDQIKARSDVSDTAVSKPSAVVYSQPAVHSDVAAVVKTAGDRCDVSGDEQLMNLNNGMNTNDCAVHSGITKTFESAATV